MWKKRTDKKKFKNRKRSKTKKQTDSTYYNYYLLAHSKKN